MCKRLAACISILTEMFEKGSLRQDVDKFIESASKYSRWMLYSDYCLDDKGKPNDVVTYALMPFVSEAKIQELESFTDSHQPKDIKNSRKINPQYINYIRQLPVFCFSFILEDRKTLFGDSGKDRVDSVVKILTELKNQFNIWSQNQTDVTLKNLYADTAKKIERQTKKLHPNANIKNLMDMLLIVFLGAFYTANILKRLPHLEIFGWFPDRDRINDACERASVEIFNAVQYNHLSNPNYKFCYNLPDSTTAPFYDKENRIVDVICGAIADFDMRQNGISKEKFRTVLQGLLADNSFIHTHRIFTQKEEVHLSDIKMSLLPLDKTLVSIITPTYNCAKFIADTIESVQAQTYTNWEMIIVDDCSSDNTKEIVEQYQKEDPRIQYHCLPRNSGAAEARNAALRCAQGRWIAFLDSDDLWKPEKLERQIKFMEDNGYAFSYHEYDEIDEESNPIGVHVSGKKHVGKFDMFACCWPGCLSVMYDVEKIGLIQIENVKKNNDTALWLKAIKKADCHLLPENLALYRRRKGSITPPDIKTKIKWHYTLFRQAEKMNPLASTFWMTLNILGNSYKKLLYVKKTPKKV